MHTVTVYQRWIVVVLKVKVNKSICFYWISKSLLTCLFPCDFLLLHVLKHLKPTYEQQQPSANMMQSGPGFGYNQAQFPTSHGPQHAGIMRQKSIGNSLQRHHTHSSESELRVSFSKLFDWFKFHCLGFYSSRYSTFCVPHYSFWCFWCSCV